MQRPQTQTAMNQRQHIPAHIEQAMTKQLQQSSMPAHLKKYVGTDRPAYVPQHIEKQLNQQMQKNMPNHLKQYSGAYMEQKVIQPSSARPSVQTSAGITPHAPTPDKLRRDHSMYGSQFTVDPTTLADSSVPVQTGQQPGQMVQPQQPVNPAGNYDFIMNPAQPPKQSRFPGSNSAPMRALLVSGLLFVILVGFVIVRNVLGGSSPLPGFIAIAQDQQSLIQLTTTVSEQQNLSVSNQNVAATAQLSLSSAQTAMVDYIKDNGQSVDVKVLNQKVSDETTKRLEDAAAATTYNQTFQELMRDQLTNYIAHLQQTYDKTSGEKGRALLSDQYDQAQLLLNQLEQASSTASTD